MNQMPPHTAEPFEGMPFEKEIRASAKYSTELRREADRLFKLMREPLQNESQAEARLEALQELRVRPFSNPGLMGTVQKSGVSSGVTRRLPSSRLI